MTITRKEMATMLDKRRYGEEMSKADQNAAAFAGLVVAFGGSDDNLEFRGAINDEVGAYQGTTVQIDTEGLLPKFEELTIDNQDLTSHNKDAFRDYFRREGKGVDLTIKWNEVDGPFWTFETEIPHETFDIMEDQGVFCRGIVFRLADAKPKE